MVKLSDEPVAEGSVRVRIGMPRIGQKTDARKAWHHDVIDIRNITGRRVLSAPPAIL
jgi:hypothetical protein